MRPNPLLLLACAALLAALLAGFPPGALAASKSAPRPRATGGGAGGRQPGSETDPIAAIFARGMDLCAGGPTQECCGALSAILGSPTSAVTRCMCTAQLAVSLDRAGASIPEVAAACLAAGRGAPGRIAGYLDRQAATCPVGDGSGRRSEREAAANRLAPLLRATQGAAGRRGAAAWSLRNLEQGIVGGQMALAGVSAVVRSLCYNALVWAPLAGAAAFAVSLAVGLAAPRAGGAALAALEPEARMVVLQHARFAAMFALQVVPYTVMAARFFFRRWDAQYFVGDDAHICELGVIVGLFAFSHAFMYCEEAALRATVRFNALLVLHHALFFLLLACALWLGPSMLVVKVVVALDLGAVHEAPLFVALVVYRLCERPAVARRFIAAGLSWYVLTRVLQTALVIALLALGDESLRLSAAYIMCAVVAGALTAVQLYTVIIYRGIYKRAGGNRVIRSASCACAPTPAGPKPMECA